MPPMIPRVLYKSKFSLKTKTKVEKGGKEMETNQIESRVLSLLENINIDNGDKSVLAANIIELINDVAECKILEKKLNLYSTYEKNILGIIKEHKEEIKFANSIQEDLRRERSQFFTQVLKDVCMTIKSSEVDSNVSSKWVEELVKCYTNSINISSCTADTKILDIFSSIKENAKKTKNELNEIEE